MKLDLDLELDKNTKVLDILKEFGWTMLVLAPALAPAIIFVTLVVLLDTGVLSN